MTTTGAGAPVTRRVFVRGLSLGGVAAVMTSSPAEARGAGQVPPVATRLAYRLSTRGRASCLACRAHAASRYYRRPQAAAEDRAHRGCNCAVVGHPLVVGTYNAYFNGREVWDVRWGPGYGPRAPRK